MIGRNRNVVRRATAFVCAAVFAASPHGSAAADPAGQWPSYGADTANSRYSPLDQINEKNFATLETAWTWTSPDETILKAHPRIRTWKNECTPLMVDGVLYTSTSLSQVAAIDAVTGKTRWVYDPGTFASGTPANHGFVHRGVAYWEDGELARIFIGTGDAYLIALDAATGRVVDGFGDGGRIDLTKGLGHAVERAFYAVTSPPVICRDTIVVGSSILDFPAAKQMPRGDVRGFNARTGELAWTFHTLPKSGEVGVETWKDDSWRNAGGANVWTMMSADPELGYVYLPVSTPTNDYYGGERPGDNLFGESLVCVEAATGKRVWHYQLVHHGIWDYDLPAAPNLLDVTVAGEPRRLVAQVTKQAMCFVFDRVTGEPIWPIEERPVPQSKVPGERTSATQPFPTKPPAFDQQGLTEEDLLDFTPELKEQLKRLIDRYDHGAIFTPPSLRGTIAMPGATGGASWSGAVVDRESGRLYVASVTVPMVYTLTEAPATLPSRYVGQFSILAGPLGPFVAKPPFGRITAIDLNTGDHDWMVPLGEGPRDHELLAALNLPRLGWPVRGHLLVTKSLLFAAQEGVIQGIRPSDRMNATTITSYEPLEPGLWAFDKKTGREVGFVPMTKNAQGAPITYSAGGKQYIVLPVGGAGEPAQLIALAIPK